jgi:glycosyltransferase involved in cell wall biosynthesis
LSKKPLVSIIVPTYNSSSTLADCLLSIQNQSYENIELVVVDNNSKDATKDIAKQYTNHVYNKGPERSAQRNYGVSKATGVYVLIIDSDMKLDTDVVKECVDGLADASVAGLVIPEESFGEGFWAQCKKLERSFYVGVSWMEAARAFRRDSYIAVGGYDESMVSGEDWDLSQRVEKLGKLGRVESYIFHNEGRLKLWTTLKKKYYYAQKFSVYAQKNKAHMNVSGQTGPLNRYKLYFSKPFKLIRNPVISIGMIVMKTFEFAVGAIGVMRKESH